LRAGKPSLGLADTRPTRLGRSPRYIHDRWRGSASPFLRHLVAAPADSKVAGWGRATGLLHFRALVVRRTDIVNRVPYRRALLHEHIREQPGHLQRPGFSLSGRRLNRSIPGNDQPENASQRKVTHSPASPSSGPSLSQTATVSAGVALPADSLLQCEALATLDRRQRLINRGSVTRSGPTYTYKSPRSSLR
jgi:hypothetical protein